MVKYKVLRRLLESPTNKNNIEKIKKRLDKLKPFDFYLLFHQTDMKYLRHLGLVKYFYLACYKSNNSIYADIELDTHNYFKNEYKRYLIYMILDDL